MLVLGRVHLQSVSVFHCHRSLPETYCWTKIRLTSGKYSMKNAKVLAPSKVVGLGISDGKEMSFGGRWSLSDVAGPPFQVGDFFEAWGLMAAELLLDVRLLGNWEP